MKKIIMLILAFSLLAVMLLGCSEPDLSAQAPTENLVPAGSESVWEEYWNSDDGYYAEDVLPDADTARVVAQHIFEVFREKYNLENYEVKWVDYYGEQNAWEVHFGKIQRGKLYLLGGGLTIYLNKTDGTVMRVIPG